MIEWKFKEDAELVSPEGFWYEVTEGGYIKPGVILGIWKLIEIILWFIERF